MTYYTVGVRGRDFGPLFVSEMPTRDKISKWTTNPAEAIQCREIADALMLIERYARFGTTQAWRLFRIETEVKAVEVV